MMGIASLSRWELETNPPAACSVFRLPGFVVPRTSPLRGLNSQVVLFVPGEKELNLALRQKWKRVYCTEATSFVLVRARNAHGSAPDRTCEKGLD